MSRRTQAGVVALAISVCLLVFAAFYPVKYTVYYPGPTFDVLGKTAAGRVITVDGHREYRDGGALRMLTVSPTGPGDHVSLMRAMSAWISPDDAVYPYDDIYGPTDSTATVEQQSAEEMTSSQDDAVAAALHQLGIAYTKAVKVASVDKSGPAYGKLKVGDLIVSADGTAVRTPDQVVKLVQQAKVGSDVRLVLRRGTTVVRTTVPTVASTVTKGKAAIRVAVQATYDFPFTVDVHLSSDIGGPSAGMMFAMGIYDLLTPGSLTGGKDIAGTGEITPDGTVGEIGGIRQKMVAAQAAGARLFLVPAGNCAEALGGHYDPKRMRLAKVSTLSGAIADVKAWVRNPKADLARCTK